MYPEVCPKCGESGPPRWVSSTTTGNRYGNQANRGVVWFVCGDPYFCSELCNGCHKMTVMCYNCHEQTEIIPHPRNWQLCYNVSHGS